MDYITNIRKMFGLVIENNLYRIKYNHKLAKLIMKMSSGTQRDGVEKDQDRVGTRWRVTRGRCRFTTGRQLQGICLEGYSNTG